MTSRPDWAGALVMLYSDRFDEFVRLAFLVTGEGMAAEEIVQDAFLATHEQWESVGNPGAYVRTSVVNRARSWLRHRKVEQRHAHSPSVSTVAEPDEIWDALERLVPDQRAVVVLRYYEDMSHKEIALVLGVAVATSRALLFRGIRQLREEFQP